MIITDLSNSDYHKRSEIGSSDIRKMLTTAKHYKYAKDHPGKPNVSQTLGSVAHCLLLEPDTFNSRFIACPDVKLDGRTKDGKAQKAEKEENEAKGLETIYKDEMIAAEQMVESIKSFTIASDLLKLPGIAEVSIFNKLQGMECKCRPDWFAESYAIVDIKSSHDASPKNFWRSCMDFGYYIQAPFYQDLVEVETGERLEHYIIAVENDPPYATCVHQISDLEMSVGRNEYKKGLTLIEQCLEHDSWPGFEEAAHEVRFPKWFFQNAFLAEVYDQRTT